MKEGPSCVRINPEKENENVKTFYSDPEGSTPSR
jgi:hypothetical protein